MRYYLAAKFSRRAELEDLYYNQFSVKLPDWVCTSRWVFGGEQGLNRKDIAALDLEDVGRADALIIFTHKRGSKQPGGGRFVEMGYALGKKKKVIVIGDYENVFTHTPGVEVYPTLDAFFNHVAPVQS